MWVFFVALFLPSALAKKELLAEARSIPEQCGLGDTVQFWVNTANSARETTLQIVGGDFQLQDFNAVNISSF